MNFGIASKPKIIISYTPYFEGLLRAHLCKISTGVYNIGVFIAMKRMAIFYIIACIAITPAVFAETWQPAGDQWIEKWWGLDLILNTGDFNVTGEIDYLSQGTDGVISDVSVSTRYGAGLTGRLTVNLPDNGGTLGWGIVDIDNTDGNNMSSSHGFTTERNNVTWQGIILIQSPNNRRTKIHPTHDDYAQIWLNGDKVYDNSAWTGGVHAVTQPTEVDLIKGENFLHFRCGEGGGSDYLNLRFEEADDDLRIAPTLDNKFLDILTPVEPRNKIATTWADIKR